MDDTTAIIVGAFIAGIAVILNEHGNEEEVQEVIEGWNHLSVLLFFNSSFINIYNYDRVIDIFRRQTSASNEEQCWNQAAQTNSVNFSRVYSAARRPAREEGAGAAIECENCDRKRSSRAVRS